MTLRHRIFILRKGFERFVHHFVAPLRTLSAVLDALAILASVACITSLVLYAGFEDSVVSFRRILPVLRAVQGVFAVKVLYGLVFLFRDTVRQTRVIKWIVDGGVLLSLLPWVYPRPTMPWVQWLDSMLYSPYFLVTVLGAYSAVTVSYTLIRMMGRHTNPSLLLSGSFILFILIGSVVLMLPRCTYHGISYVDSLFVSTSAVCITGLTTVNVAEVFTPIGLCVIALMLQIGALGVMTFTSFFALFFSGNTSIYSQLMVRDMVYSKSINALLPTLLYILLFTLTVEALGAVGIWWTVHDTIPGMTPRRELLFAVFHSMSAFCNAGFSTLPDGLSTPGLLHGPQSFYLVISALVVAGGIGFPILVNAKDALFERARRLWRRITHRRQLPKVIHLYNVNTRLAVTTTLVLLVVGTILFWLFEHNHSLAHMTAGQQAVQSLFNAVTPRSAGFSSVNPAGFLNVTIIMIMFLMWVGGGSQSTAGGVKVNTLAVMLLHLRATIFGRHRVVTCDRTVSDGSLARAQAVIALSILSYLVYAMLLLLLEPKLPTGHLLFEACSALFTVGSSLGVTPLLSDGAKILLCTAMFLGRVGLLSLLAGLAGTRSEPPVQYPSDNVIIN